MTATVVLCLLIDFGLVAVDTGAHWRQRSQSHLLGKRSGEGSAPPVGDEESSQEQADQDQTFE